MDYTYIERKTDLRHYLKELEDNNNKILALDIEADMFLHSYGEKLCLIQINDGINKLIIDPLKIDNDTLRLLFENRDILKVMYDAASDLFLLKNTLNMDIKSILDLRPAVHLLNYPKQDLHSVLYYELGISLEKKKKYQRHNWLKRPVSEEAIDYAINDVAYLLLLKDALLEKLHSKRLLEPFILSNLKIQNRDYTRKPEDKYKIRGYANLQDEEKAAFRRVFDTREKYAKRLNMPSNNIIHNTDLINIVKDAEYINKIRFPKRFSNELVYTIARELRTAINKK